MRACSGTWIAHGSGSADRETVDRHDRVAVPPEHPLYQIRRIWLTPEEETGILRRLRQRGPVAAVPHRARAADVPLRRLRALPERQREVRRRGGRRGEDEGPGGPGAGLPLRAAAADDPRPPARARPSSRSGTFPGPIPRRSRSARGAIELLDGLLGSSILGFHTQFHCNNFLDTVDRLLEARVDREAFTITCRGQSTAGAPLPDLDRVAARARSPRSKSVPDARRAVRERLRLPRESPARRRASTASTTRRASSSASTPSRACSRSSRAGSAASRSSRSRRRRAGRSTTIAITRRGCARAPTRSTPAYANARHPPIVLLAEHHEPDAVYEYQRAADLCFVTQPPRRDEPGCEGVRRRARRRAGGADPVPVRRGFARAARGAGGQPLRRRPVRGGAASGD